MSTSHEDYASMYGEPFRDQSRAAFDLELSYRLRKFSDRWKLASNAEKQELLKQMAEVERLTEIEFFGAKPEPKPQTTLRERLRLS